MTTGRYVSVAVMALALLAVGASADEPRQGGFMGETNVNVVDVPVRVIDPATGKAVVGLTSADFEIREAGSIHEVSNFTEIARPPRDETVPGSQVMPANATTRPVEIIYFFDLYLNLKGDKLRALKGVRELYASSMAEQERVSVVAFNGDLEVVLERSDDIYDLDEALEEVEDIPSRGIQQYISFTDSLSKGEVSGERNQDFYERRQRSREYMGELEKKVSRVGTALSATMARFALADAHKVVVVFSPGFPGSNWSPSYSPVDFLYGSARYPAESLWEKLAQEASDLGFTLHVVDSSGLRASTAADAEIGVTDSIASQFAEGEVFGRGSDLRRLEPSNTDPDQAAARTDPNAGSGNLGAWIERSRKNLLVAAAETTGGSAYFDGDVGAALSKVEASLDHYYSMAYTASHLGDGEVYEIEVTLPNLPDYEVIHRTSYVDTPASDRQALRLRAAMLFGGDANPLGIRVETGDAESRFRLGAAGSKRVKLPLEVKIPFARIELIPMGDVWSGSLLITFFGEDGDGNQSQLSSLVQEVSVTDAKYEEAISRGYFSYKAEVEVEGGQQQVFVGIQDQLSGRTSIVPLTLEF